MDRSPDEARKTRVAVCRTHGEYQSTNLFREIWTRCPTCAEVEATARRAEEMETARRRHEQRVNEAQVPFRFIGKRFSDVEAPTDEQRQAFTVVRDYFETFEVQHRKGHGLILTGMPGTGKTLLASAGLQGLVDRFDVRYATCQELLREVRGSWRRDSGRSSASVLDAFGGFDLLTIDELGVGYGTEGEMNILFDVIDARYRNLLPTILITNDTVAGLRTAIGDRAYDRLVETCRAVVFDWPSYRATARRQSLDAAGTSTADAEDVAPRRPTKGSGNHWDGAI